MLKADMKKRSNKISKVVSLASSEERRYGAVVMSSDRRMRRAFPSSRSETSGVGKSGSSVTPGMVHTPSKLRKFGPTPSRSRTTYSIH